MLKNLFILLLLLVVVGGGAYIYLSKRSAPKSVATLMPMKIVTSPSPPANASPTTSNKGMLADSPDVKFAYKVFPGPLSVKATTALNGWNIDSTVQTDGSTQVTLTPKNADDQKKTFTVKSGESLYFVEKNSFDDSTTGLDANLHDDYGIVVDASGAIL